MFQIIMKIVNKVTLFLLLLSVNSAFSQEQIGVASAVNKNTTDLTLEQERKLIDAGYEIIQNHTIETDEIGRAQMLLLDGTAFSVGPNSSVILDRFIYNPETAEGSLEVTARGLLRIVGGKVTKKQPALIRTNSATVGIRGGIGIVKTEGTQTTATFLYGDEMTVTPNCVDLDSFGDQCSADYQTTVTEPGFSVTVEDEDSEPSEPVEVTEESLDEMQEDLEASDEEPEDSSSAEADESENDQTEEDSSSPEAEESQNEDTNEEESAPISSDETEDNNEPIEETPSAEEPADTNDDAGDSSDVDVDESMLDSSGVSEASSDVEPEDLGTADAYEAEVEAETVEADDMNEDPTEDIGEAATESTQEAAAEVAPIFQVDNADPKESIDENINNEVLAALTFINPGDLSFTVSISGDDADFVQFDDESFSIMLTKALDYETQTSLNFVVTIESENGDTSEILFDLSVSDIDEPVDLSSALTADSFAENLDVGSVIAETSAIDPEGGEITYSLSGEGSDDFEVDADGNISIKNPLDYESITEYSLTLSVSDGNNISTQEISIVIADINEAPVVSSVINSDSFAEDISTGFAIASIDATDPESSDITFSLSGDGSDLFSIDAEGNITLAGNFDYETSASYNITISASDGENITTSEILISISDVNEAPTLSAATSAASFAEDITTGSQIATFTAIDPEAGDMTYSLSGTGSELFSIDAAGNITLNSNFDFETASSYSLTLTVTDGVHQVSEVISITITDVNEAPTSSIAMTSSSFSEDVAVGTTIANASATDPEGGSITYTLTGEGSDKFTVDSNGNISLSGALDYETVSSFSFTLTVSDGVNSTSEVISFSVLDVVELSIALASSTISISEGAASGSAVTTTTTTTDGSGTVTYSLSGTGSDKFSVSSDGTITTNGSFDYETTTSYSITLTATDGTSTVTETFTVNVTNEVINGLSVTLANSGAAIGESSSSGSSVASSSINNPDSDSVTYSLSGTGSSNFSVDSSGNVTTNATLDFETAKSYSLTLTATTGDTTVTDTFTVNVGNVEELESAVLRYSAAYNSVSRSGFSATATRGPSGSSLAAYTLEQVGTTNSTVITSVDDTSNNYVPVEINSGTVLNWRYYFPIDTSGNGEFAFAPNSSALDGKYYSPLGTAVTTTIANAEFLTAGRLRGAEYWFMTTDKSAADVSYTSATGQRTYGIVVGDNTYYGTTYSSDGTTSSYSTSWATAITGAGYTYLNCFGLNVSTCLSDAGISLDDVGFIASNTLGTINFGYTNSQIADWIDGGGNMFLVVGEHPGWSGPRLENNTQVQAIFSELGWSGFALDTTRSNFNSTTTISSTMTNAITNAGGTLDYSGIVGQVYSPAASGYFSIPSVCNAFIDLILMVCDPGRTGASGTFGGVADTNPFATSVNYGDNYDIMQWFAGLGNGTATTSTYSLYEDQVTLAGEVYKDANFVSFTNGNKRVIAMVVIPLENFAASGTSDDYFIPNFIPKTLWSYGDVGHDYCLGVGNNASACNTYDNYYDFSSIALDSSDMLDTSRFNGSTNELPEGQSMWWQVLNPSGVGVGLWAQISFKDSYDGASGSTTRDDQQSLLNVVISNVDYRKNDTTRYSAGDTGLGMDGYHYWSYQGATNADNDGLGINYGTSPIECATSNESGCFWGAANRLGVVQPGGAMITSSDPYKSGNMTLGVNYNSNNDTFSTGSFNISAVVQDVNPSGSSYEDYASLSDFRSSDFYTSSATGYSGFFSGILEFDVSGTGNSQLSSIRSSSTLASFTFDTTNDDVQVVAPMTISAAPSNNYTSNWTTVDTGSMTLKFGDATNDAAKSAYISSEVFGAEIQDDGAQIDGTSGGSNNLAGVMVSYNTLDKEDSDLFHSGGNDSMPDTEYSTWGFWAMSAADISPNAGTQNASVHLGTWVGGEVVDQSEIPTSGSASMSGAAVVNVAYRYNQTGTNYDVHKYTTTADVAATFNWGSSGYSGTLAFTDFDNKNPIVDNAGFASFSVAITGTDNTYTGNSTDSLSNSWLGGASVAGTLYGDSSPDESGGRVNVNLYKSGDTSTAGANDFYFAEGIYLVD